jgi:phage shock protein PspC (stress-responsive transcriptional regulator)
MKKTIHINLSGIAFRIEEDAFNRLQNYLKDVEAALGTDNGAKETLQDIESRIAEIFMPIANQPDTSVTIKDVEDVIRMIGVPSDFGTIDQDTTSRATENPSAPPAPPVSKRLFRDPYNRVFGGVCSGLGAYFKIEPLIFRLIFLIGTIWGILLIPYIILWIVMPKALTMEQRRQMFGGDQPPYKTNYPNSQINIGTDAGNAFLRVLGIVTGVVLIIVTFTAMVTLTMVLFFSPLVIDVFPHLYWIQQLNDILLIPQQSFILLMGSALLTGIPLLMLFYLGLHLLFKFQKGGKTIGALGLIFWLLGLGMVIYAAVTLGHDFKETARMEEVITPKPFRGDTLYLEANEWPYRHTHNKLEYGNQLASYISNGRLFTEGNPSIYLRKNADRMAITLTREARGRNTDDAQKNADDIEFFWLQSDSVIQIDPCFTLRMGSKIRNQKMSITIEMPKGKYLKAEPMLQNKIRW